MKVQATDFQKVLLEGSGDVFTGILSNVNLQVYKFYNGFKIFCHLKNLSDLDFKEVDFEVGEVNDKGISYTPNLISL